MFAIIAHDNSTIWPGYGYFIWKGPVKGQGESWVLRCAPIVGDDFGVTLTPAMTSEGANALLSGINSELVSGATAFSVPNWIAANPDALRLSDQPAA